MTDIDKLIKYVSRRKENFTDSDTFSEGAQHAYQDVLYLLEDLQADSDYPLDRIIADLSKNNLGL